MTTPPAPAEPDPPGFELPLLLFAGFRALIDALHAELAVQGHPGVRPAYGFAMQAIGPHGVHESGVAFLQKPITPESIARSVREVLGSAESR